MSSKAGGGAPSVKVSYPRVLEGWILLSWVVFIVNLTQPRAMGGEGTSAGELSTSDWPVALLVRNCLHW